MFLWTSEAVSAGHPDKVADQIADAILDAHLEANPQTRCGCEVTCCKDLVLVTGEVSGTPLPTSTINAIVRKKLLDIGYNGGDSGYDGNNVQILNKMNSQSAEIAGAVVKQDGEIGAGDQGMMFGYACDETPEYMPLAHNLAFRIINILQENRGARSTLLPDAKSQVTIEYDNDHTPKGIYGILVSTQHLGSLTDVRELVTTMLRTFLPSPSLKFPLRHTNILVNPGGEWHIGGPASDTGLSGRKIVVDNYGADCPIGGGSFSGKDPTKVDRSAAYAARYIAKNIVAAGLAKRAQVQLAYAIGCIQPVSARVDTFGTGKVEDDILTKAFCFGFIDKEARFSEPLMSLSPKGIIERFQLRRPIYAATASGGHFGRAGFPWEELTLVKPLQDAFNK